MCIRDRGNVYATLAKAFTGITAYSFLVFNLLCAPCFAAIGAIKREMNSAKSVSYTHLKEKLVIPGAPHAEASTVDPEKYWSTVDKFIKKYL